MAHPRELWEWLSKRRKRTGYSTLTLRDMYSSGPSIIRSKSDYARELVNKLISRGYLRPVGNVYEMRPENDL